MEMKGNHGLGNTSTCNGDIQGTENKFMQCSDDQVMVLEQFFVECPSPSQATRLAMIRENSVLSNLDSQQIGAWFENRRSLEKKKMAATGKLLLLEQNYLHGTVQQLLREKEYFRMLLQCTSLESFPAPEIPRSVFENLKIVASRRKQLLLKNEYLHNEVQHLHRGNEYIQILLENVDDIRNSEAAVNPDMDFPGDAYNTRLLLFSETMTMFTPKTPIACDWVSIPRMKFFEGIKDIFATMLPDGLLDLFLHQHQEFEVSCSIKDIKLDQVFFKDGEKSLTAIVPALLPLDIKLNQISFKEKEELLIGAASSFMPQNIKLDKIAFKDCEESLTAVLSAFLPQMALKESLDKLKKQQEMCQTTLSSIKASSKSTPAVKFSSNIQRLQQINIIRKAPEGVQIKRVINLLRETRQAFTAEQINEACFVDVKANKAYPNHPRLPINVDDDLKQLFEGIKLPEDMIDIEKDLQKNEMKPATNTAERRAQAHVHCISIKPKQKKKKHEIRKRTKLTNSHLPELFKNLS